MAKYILVYLLLLNITNALFAQSPLGEICGTVKTNTGTLLPFATITLYKGNELVSSCLSTQKGYYEFKGLLPDSTYSVLIQKRPFAKFEITDVWVIADQRTWCNEVLPLSKSRKMILRKKWVSPSVQAPGDHR